MATGSKLGKVRQLVALMAAHGVTRCVLCPGSRNAPLLYSLSQRPEMECRAVTDERSAGFAALGWAARTGKPVAVCVTSGSALLNLHPSVAEAHYRRLPLLILSADRPAAWIGQQDGQTLPQPGVFGTLTRASVNLPDVGESPASPEDEWYTNRLLNEAMLELSHRGGGPVHINIPLREPLFELTEDSLPRVRVIRRTEFCALEKERPLLTDLLHRYPRRLLLLGQREQALALPPAWEEKRLPIVGEHLCNTRCTCRQPDTLIGPTLRPELSPDLLLTVGGCILSKRLKTLLRKHPPREHWHISREGDLTDTFCCLTRCLEGEPSDVLRHLADMADEGDASYQRLWQARPIPFRGPWCGMSLVGLLLQSLSPRCVLHLGNSSAVRYAQLFPLPEGVLAVCNRGVNGIEGSLSTALGYAMGDERLHVVLCGDLSFFYDMNALWMEGVSPRVRILLLNNGGGGIFSTLPGMPCNRYIEARHSATAEGWARSCGFRYRPLRDEGDCAAALEELLSPTATRPVLVEAFTQAETDARLLRQFFTEH